MKKYTLTSTLIIRLFRTNYKKSHILFPKVKITSNNEDMLRSACEQFADKKVGDIQDIARFFLFFSCYVAGLFLFFCLCCCWHEPWDLGPHPKSNLLPLLRATLEGHQRAIIGHMTVDEIFKDRKKFSEQVGQWKIIRSGGKICIFNPRCMSRPPLIFSTWELM